jgi:hypothetical protein
MRQTTSSTNALRMVQPKPSSSGRSAAQGTKTEHHAKRGAVEDETALQISGSVGPAVADRVTQQEAARLVDRKAQIGDL